MLCLSIVLVVCVGQQSGAQHGAPEASPAVQLRALKAEGYLALRNLNRSDAPGTDEAVRRQRAERARTREADLVRRVLTLAKDHPEATEAPAALNWAFGELLGGYFGKSTAACDAICAAVTRVPRPPRDLAAGRRDLGRRRLGSPGPAVPGDGPEAKYQPRHPGHGLL